MALNFRERPNSREYSDIPPGLTTRWRASGEPDPAIVQAAARSLTPIAQTISAGVVYRQNIAVADAGHRLYDVTVTYGQKRHNVGDWSFSFDTTGGTLRITAAKEHIRSYPDDGNTHKGTIGVKPDGDPEGCDIIIPAMKLSVTFRHAQGAVGIGFVKTLARATGHTNSDSFLTFAPGELLFLGGTGSDGREAEAEVTYHFAASENAVGLQYGDIDSIAKKGHEYIWVEFEQKDSAGKAATVPKLIHVERVYDPISFSGTFGWS